jgi:pseudouridylate synthase
MGVLNYVKFGEEVRAALEEHRPVVALESTLITHGLPRPLNEQTAREMEQEVRDVGAIPATICLLDGIIRTGLSDDELARLASLDDAIKISSRGLAYAITRKRNAGTTVSGTMAIANQVGIQFFGTGGIGGVHFGASETGDISTDLSELSRTPVAVVSAGIKSILDIARTVEYLETAGIPVFGYQTDEFPAFFSGASGITAPYRIDTPEEAAAVWHTHREIGLPTGMLIACPPPVTVEDATALEGAIQQANREVMEQGISSGAVTPFVLKRIAEITDGASVRVNIALLRHNARIAAEIAVAHSAISAVRLASDAILGDNDAP